MSKGNKGIARATKLAKREEAEARAAERANRSPKDQLARLDAGGFRAVKERARLGALLSKKGEQA